jgi:hypothetical protein
MNSKEFQAMPNLKRGVGTNVQIELCSWKANDRIMGTYGDKLPYHCGMFSKLNAFEEWTSACRHVQVA